MRETCGDRSVGPGHQRGKVEGEVVRAVRDDYEKRATASINRCRGVKGSKEALEGVGRAEGGDDAKPRARRDAVT